MNGEEQRTRHDAIAQINKQLDDVVAILEAHTTAIAMLSREVMALKARLDEEERGTLVDLRGNRLRTSTRN